MKDSFDDQFKGQANNPYASPFETSAPSRRQYSGPLATRTDRFFGALLDGLIMAIVAFPVGFAIGIFAAVGGNRAAVDRFGGIVANVIVSVLIYVLINGYLLATAGQTVGKYLMKIRIVTPEGYVPGFSSLLFRRYFPLLVAANVPYIGPVAAIVNALAIFRANHRCLHDDLCNTYVIRVVA